MRDAVIVQLLEGDSWLNDGVAVLIADLEDLVHSMEVESHGTVQTRSGAAIAASLIQISKAVKQRGKRISKKRTPSSCP